MKLDTEKQAVKSVILCTWYLEMLCCGLYMQGASSLCHVDWHFSCLCWLSFQNWYKLL